MKVIDRNSFYLITDELYRCCDEYQFTYICRACREKMGCYYCTFDYTERHDCLED